MAYNYQFLREADDRLKCLICFEVAKDPKQHGVCGKLFCSECIEKNGNNPCPNCRVKKPQYFKDMKSLQEIRDLRVRCDNVERGCVWEGTVGMFDGHVTKCGFTSVSCPKKCKVEGEKSQLMRKNLDDHLKTECPNRDYECKHCGEKDTYASITEEHDSVCNNKIVPCPNIGCTSAMERGLTKKHTQTVCNYAIVACKYASIGCSVKEVRMEMKQHEEDNKSHLGLALDKIVKLVDVISSQNATMSSLQDTTSSLKATTSSLEATTASLKDTTSSQNAAISSLKDTTSSLENTTSSLEKNMYTLKRDKSISFNLSGYSMKKEDDVIFYSEPFYTSPGGYKMCTRVYPNGIGACKGTHVSVCSQLLEGPYDDNLPWPFLGTVSFELLNQLADDDHHSKMTLYKTTATCNIRVGSVWGYLRFIPHSELSHDQARNIQYLMEDTLYFRVTVEVDQHKPWLHCTYHTK